ncbi:MAG: DUF3843 family protein [Prevotella sp.]
MKSIIPVSEITKRHPDLLYCSTDSEYATLANNIYDIVGDELTFMDDKEIRNMCVSLALYFEDIHSGTHQFDAFTRLYGKMYGMYLPFYSSKDSSSPDADLDAMKFVIWLSIVAERCSSIVNPSNASIAALAEYLLNYWNSTKHAITPNEELADFIFSEETQDDPYLIRSVMVWLQSRSYLGRWYSNPVFEEDYYGVRKMFPNIKRQDVRELTEDCSVFEYQSWPLSIPATRAYAEMIRIDIDDPDDEIAAEIEKMEYEKLQFYKISGIDKEYLAVENFRKRRFDILLSSFGNDIRKDVKRNTHFFGSFFSFRGKWFFNGHAAFLQMTDSRYADYCDKMNEKYSIFHDYLGQYDELVERNEGKRLLFFNSPEEVEAWMRTKVGIENFESFSLSSLPAGRALMVFLHPNGQMLFTVGAECVESPDNPYYDRDMAEEDALTLCLLTESSHPDLVLYLIEHDLVPDAMFNDRNGKEHGRVLLQDNLDFMVRCIRRDIESDKVARRRNEICMTDNDANDSGRKMNFETFVNVLSQEKTVRSKANKKWRVVRCNKTSTVIRDVSNRKDFTMPTSSLYTAYIEIDEEKIQVATVSRYVSSANAPAASALLYNTVGKGKQWNAFNKSMERLVQLLDKEL